VPTLGSRGWVRAASYGGEGLHRGGEREGGGGAGACAEGHTTLGLWLTMGERRGAAGARQGPTREGDHHGYGREEEE
jgi:hypothetical protein